MAADTTVNTAPAATSAIVIPDGMKGELMHFRKEKVLDAEGKEIGEAFKHPSVTIPLPLPTREQVLAIFSDDTKLAEQKFILDAIYDEFYLQAREQINDAREQNKDNNEFRVTPNVIDYSKLTITALANMPASERGNKVSEEDMKAFLADYMAVMPSALNKEASKVKAQAGLLEKELRTVKTDKPVLKVMEQCITVWANATGSMEEHQQVYERLVGRIKRYLQAEPKKLMDSIM